jgi:undecaprenyl-diphosphatase
MVDWIKVIILGIVEGITEFLPISSTGHLIVVASIIGFATDRADNFRSTFEIFIQLGAVLAVIIYYWTDLFHQLKTVRTDVKVQRHWLNIVVAFIPAAAIGFLLSENLQTIMDTPRLGPVVVGAALIVGGLIFLIVERLGLAKSGQTTELKVISLRQAVIIGIAQVAALIPGMSRSGASIVGGMLAGLDRSTATQFSFYLAIPTLGLATIYSLARNISAINSDDFVMLLVGMAISGVVAWLSIGWLLRYVARNSFVPFGYYRILAGIVILIFIGLGWLR